MSLAVGTRTIAACGISCFVLFLLTVFVFVILIFTDHLYTMKCLLLRFLCVRNQLQDE